MTQQNSNIDSSESWFGICFSIFQGSPRISMTIDLAAWDEERASATIECRSTPDAYYRYWYVHNRYM